MSKKLGFYLGNSVFRLGEHEIEDSVDIGHFKSGSILKESRSDRLERIGTRSSESHFAIVQIIEYRLSKQTKMIYIYLFQFVENCCQLTLHSKTCFSVSLEQNLSSSSSILFFYKQFR